MEVTQDQLKTLKWAAGEAYIEPEDIRDDYSGRFMFGSRCFGIVVDSEAQMLDFLKELRAEDEELCEKVGTGVKSDSMATRVIYYWEHVGTNGVEVEEQA